MPSFNVCADLIRERAKCSFDPIELTHLFDGGEAKTIERRNTENEFLSDPKFKDPIPTEYLSHKEKYEEAVRKACYLFQKFQEYTDKHGGGGMKQFAEILGGKLGSAILKDGSPITLHYVMFIPAIMGQGTAEQQAEWISRSWNCNIIGTYAQTELGHGTFIRGLETIAEYDEKTQEFVLNSPTLTSYKWWPGGLGQSANYAVVVAQLYTKGQNHGIHPFIVQLRDEETHMPLPGIKIGEIGSKMGLNSTNNGFLGFKDVRIPRNHMLMKNNQVLEDGTFIKSPNSKLTYGTMMFVRVVILQEMVSYLMKATTIATRYSAVRRQSQPKPDEPEPQILDYLTQQYKLFPHIATCFAFNFSAEWLWEYYNSVNSELDAGDMDRLPELHAIACCLKAVCTADATIGVETCRLACGGHGYMTSSNLHNTYSLTSAACTYEGENTVLLLQTARYLLKAWEQALNGSKMTPTVSYLAKAAKNPNVAWKSNYEGILQGFQLIAAGKIASCAKDIAAHMKKGMCYEDAWNMTSVQLVAAAEAHCRCFIIEKFNERMQVKTENMSQNLKNVLLSLMDLYIVYWTLKCSGDFLRYTKITGRDLDDLQHRLEGLLMKLRPEAVGIVDGFDIRDEILASPLGAYDGRVYERLMEEAMKSPLNAEPVNRSFHLYLKPLMKSKI